MNHPLKINCQWLGPANDGADGAAEACRAAIEITAGELPLTRLFDTRANTVRNHVYACSYTLGSWLAGNWWRLRYEPETARSREETDWRLSHSLASVGGGFSWPSILFTSDGQTVGVASNPSGESAMGSVRYLTSGGTRLSGQEFERGIDDFMTLVIARLHAEGHTGTDLAKLWEVVSRERTDKEMARRRRLEAICGYDPEEAPEPLLRALIEDPAELGHRGLEEVAAHFRHQTPNALEAISSLATNKKKPETGGFRCQPASLPSLPSYQKGMRPWEKASKLAETARREWGLGNGPVSNAVLSDILKTPKKSFADHSAKAATPLSLALRSSSHKNIDIYLASSWGTSRRFTTSRLLGDWLEKRKRPERLVPASEARTAEQQFQRAFAQEFLCPHAALLNRLQTEHPTADEFEDAAQYFGVSSWVVRTTLVNKGDLDRIALA